MVILLIETFHNSVYFHTANSTDMRPILSLLAILFIQTINAQNSSALVTMAGISDLKVGMKKADLEKLLSQTLSTPHLSKDNDDWYQDTVRVTYKGIDADVIFQREYGENKKFDIVVWEIKSSSNTLKTKSGISIGDDKLKIISTYPGYMIHILPGYEKDFTIKSKTRSSIWLFGEDGKVLVFHLTNDKVTGFSVLYSEGC